MSNLVLKCHTNLEETFTKGKSYDVEKIVRREYVIIDDKDSEHVLTMDPDDHNLSYNTWFDLIK